ncbi:MAG: hypothetical protein JST68_22345 [Bacteroidetes bacterium]|nr:hypothetical protein [Bacteroidota bacterium]
MKSLFLTMSLITISLSVMLGQPDPRNVIMFNSYSASLSITPDRRVCLLTKAGEVAIPAEKANTWNLVSPKDYTLSGPIFENINFFNRDTGFVSGFIYEGKQVYDVYYRTTDGGKKWEMRRFPDAGWADKAVHLDNGEAWVVIAGSGHIDYSNDYGVSWQRINTPEPKQRFTSLFFNKSGEGFIGSLWDYLSYTNDNGQTWRNVPTPLDQRAYEKTDINARPEIDRTAIFKDYLIVKQNGLLFFTRKDSIRWRPLLGYRDFIADNNTNALFLIDKKTVFKVDDDLQPIATYPIDGDLSTGSFNAGLLAFWDGRQLATIDEKGVVSKTPLYTDEVSEKVIKPWSVGYWENGEEIGYLNGKLYVKKNFDDKNWEYLTTLPFKAGQDSLWMIGKDSLLLKGRLDTLTYYDLKTKRLTVTTEANSIRTFCQQKISKVVFETGSQGCFHYYKDYVIYKRNDEGVFEFEKNGTKGMDHKGGLYGYPDEISGGKVESFVQGFPAALNELPSIKAMTFTPADYEKARKDIREFQQRIKQNKTSRGIEEKGFWMNENNLDFNRLLSLPDSVARLDSMRVDKLLDNMSPNFSTTTNWTAINLISEQGEVLTIRNSYDCKPNSFLFPWVVSLNGFRITRNSIAVNRFIGETYPRFVADEGHADIIEHLVQKLYKKAD